MHSFLYWSSPRGMASRHHTVWHACGREAQADGGQNQETGMKGVLGREDNSGSGEVGGPAPAEPRAKVWCGSTIKANKGCSAPQIGSSQHSPRAAQPEVQAWRRGPHGCWSDGRGPTTPNGTSTSFAETQTLVTRPLLAFGNLQPVLFSVSQAASWPQKVGRLLKKAPNSEMIPSARVDMAPGGPARQSASPLWSTIVKHEALLPVVHGGGNWGTGAQHTHLNWHTRPNASAHGIGSPPWEPGTAPGFPQVQRDRSAQRRLHSPAVCPPGTQRRARQTRPRASRGSDSTIRWRLDALCGYGWTFTFAVKDTVIQSPLAHSVLYIELPKCNPVCSHYYTCSRASFGAVKEKIPKEWAHLAAVRTVMLRPGKSGKVSDHLPLAKWHTPLYAAAPHCMCSVLLKPTICVSKGDMRWRWNLDILRRAEGGRLGTRCPAHWSGDLSALHTWRKGEKAPVTWKSNQNLKGEVSHCTDIQLQKSKLSPKNIPPKLKVAPHRFKLSCVSLHLTFVIIVCVSLGCKEMMSKCIH